MINSHVKRGRILSACCVLVLVALLVLSGCNGLVDDLFDSAWTWPSLETVDRTATSQPGESMPNNHSTGSASMPTSTATVQTTEAEDRSLDFSRPTPAFDEQVIALLLEGLENRDRSIILDPAFVYWSVREHQVQEAIDRIYELFTDIYLRQPEFFYLNGSFQVFYSVLRSGNHEIAGLRLEPTYWSSTAQMTDAELTDMIEAVQALVASLAEQIRAQTQDPIEQLISLHEWLVRHITYDETGDQGTNHAGSALLQQVTLCQGYAQAFQLVGQALGQDVRLITGMSGGIGHAWNQVIIDNIAYHVDVTHDDPTPDTDPDRPVRHVHLFRSDKVIATTHQWERDRFLPSPVDGAFYHRNRGLIVNSRNELKQRIKQFVGTVDFRTADLWQLELLYEGTDQPDRSELEALLTAEMQQQMSGRTLYYRADAEKQVLIIQISNNS